MKKPLFLLLAAVLMMVPLACPACATPPVNATPEERAAVTEQNFADLSAFLDDAQDSFLGYLALRAPDDLELQSAMVKKARELVEVAHASWQRTGDYDLTDLRSIIGKIADGYETYVQTDDRLDEDSKLKRLILVRLGRSAGRALLSRLESAGIQHEPDVPIEQLVLEHNLHRVFIAIACVSEIRDDSRVLDVGDPGGDRLATAGVGHGRHRF